MVAKTPAEVLLGLQVGNLVGIDPPFDLDPDEQFELLVKTKKDNGVLEVDVFYCEVLVKKLAAKANLDGSVTWQPL